MVGSLLPVCVPLTPATFHKTECGMRSRNKLTHVYHQLFLEELWAKDPIGLAKDPLALIGKQRKQFLLPNNRER